MPFLLSLAGISVFCIVVALLEAILALEPRADKRLTRHKKSSDRFQ
ncbi:MAG TPA: hypothetical protein V6C95_06090 [Coleofasciculaceae cyanobacterium]